MKSIAKIWSLVLVVLMVLVSCEPEMRENVTDSGDPSDIGLLTDPFTLSMSSSLASSILIAQYPDGSKKYVEGDAIEEAGLFLQIDNDYPDRRIDTIWAKTNPVEGLVAEWKVEDESVLEVVETSELPSYILVNALKTGSTKVYAWIEDKAFDTIDVVVDTRWVKQLRYNVPGPAGFYLAESTQGTFYDYDVRAETNPAKRQDQFVLRAKVDAEEAGALVGFPVTWEIVGDLDTVNDLKLTYMGDYNDSIMIETRKGVDGKGLIERMNEGVLPEDKDYIRSLDFTMRARAVYFTADAMMTIRPTNAITPIDSVVWLDMESNPTDEYEIDTKTKSAPSPVSISTLAYPGKVDHLVGGFRFGIVGVNDSIDLYKAPAKTSVSSEIVKLEVVDGTKIDGVIGVRGLKQGEAKIWVEIGDGALGEKFTVEDYGEPKRDTLIVKVSSVVTDIKVYKEGEATDCGTSNQKLTVGDDQVFEAKISDDEAHSLFKGNVVWMTEGNENDYISLVQDPTNKEKVTVTASKPATGNTAPYLYAQVTDAAGTVTTSQKFRVEVEEAASSEAEDLVFASVTVEWEDSYGYGNEFYKYIFTTAAGDQLVVPAFSPADGGHDGFLFDENRDWEVAEYGTDIGIECSPSVGITIGASGTIYQLIGGTITISNDGASAAIDLTAYPIVGGQQGTETKVTGTWTGTKPADPKP